MVEVFHRSAVFPDILETGARRVRAVGVVGMDGGSTDGNAELFNRTMPVFPFQRRSPWDSYRFISIPWARPLYTIVTLERSL